ncbi:TolC family protein [Mucilaginibacter jinjuensis]|uniref:TolC family protein n=1 Tax=Mucilaginibacter jinjuensis TaxID=1176721 RepID=A0ABY7TCV6_9SPHI|nr:TolC family protein [Mucilaginibacter jinjuensis]WCT14345.1 TolC family protein [Mucilaginibacter jinjuensis]
MKFHRSNYTLIFILGLLLLCHHTLSAQTKSTFSLSELVDSAQKHLPVLLQKQALVNSAKANVTDTRNSFLPKLNVGDELSIASSNDVEGSYIPMAGILRTTSGSIRADNNYHAQTGNIVSAYAEYDLVNFGLRGAKVENAVAYANLQQADFDKEVYIVKLQIGKLYFNILKNLYQLQIDQQNIQRYQSVNTIIGALTGSGIKPGVDSSLAKAELSKIKVSYNQRAGAIKQMQQQLSFLTGINATQINIDTLRKDDDVVASHLFSKLADSTANPLLDYFTRQKALYQSAETLVKKSYLPKIILSGGGWGRGSSIQYNDDYRSLGSGLGYQRFNYAAGIGITYDLVNIVHRKDKVAVNHYQSQAAGFDFEQQKLALRNANNQALQAIQTAEQNLNELPIQLQAATDVYNQKEAQYKAGVINLIDLTTASFVLYSAQLNYVETLNDWYVANLDRAASTGNLDLFIQTIKR